MEKIEIRKIQVEDLYVSPLAKRRVTNAEGWSRMEEVEKKVPPTGSLVMDAVAQILAEEPGLTTEELAKALGTNNAVLNHLFQFLTGKLTRDFLTEYRLKRACELLACTNLRLEEIARRSGFPSQSDLAKLFKERKQCTPREYRHLYRPKNYALLYEWE